MVKVSCDASVALLTENVFFRVESRSLIIRLFRYTFFESTVVLTEAGEMISGNGSSKNLGPM